MTESDPIRLLDPLFRTDAMRGIFSDRSRLQGILDFEAALARAESEVGIVPSTAAVTIARSCVAERFDIAELATLAGTAGNVAIPIVSALRKLVAQEDATAAGWVHWGATSQDAMDTGLVLQMRPAVAALDADAHRLADSLASLAEKHAATPILGRTWMQAAVPITFGLKAAGWLASVERSRVRLSRAAHQASIIQLGGAAGSLVSLGDHGAAVADALAGELHLKVPDLPWHAHRDRLVAVAAAIGLLIGALGKIARDISLLMQSELAEVAEPSAPGRGTSSSMPHKRNPVAAAAVLAAATRAPGLVAGLLAGLPQEHERGLGGWQAEWETVPELFLLASGALAHMAAAIDGLVVDAERMREDIDATRGLVMAEAVIMALTPMVGSDRAHALVGAAIKRTSEQRIDLRDALSADAAVVQHLTPEVFNRLFTLEDHVRAAERMVKRALQTRSTPV